MLRLTKLYFLKDNDLVIRVKYEEIKQISKKKLGFNTLFLEFCIVLQVLQKADLLVQKVLVKTDINSALPERMEDF